MLELNKMKNKKLKKKHFIFLLLFLFSFDNYSQNYLDEYKADICSCIETKKTTLTAVDNIFKACFTKNMTTYAIFIDAEIKEEDKVLKYIKGQKLRQELQQKFKYELVYSCNAYFDLIEEKKQHVLQQYRNRKIDSTKIDKLNETVAMQPHWANYFNRGQYYYFIGDLKKAEKDMLKSIEENPISETYLANTQEKLILASIYEEQKRYAEAIAIYDVINSRTVIPSVAVLRAIVSRKSKGYIMRPVEVTKKETPTVVAKEKAEKEPVKIKQRTSPRVPKTTQNFEKNKDSTQSLRKLFKLN